MSRKQDVFKIILIGDGGVGKTSLMIRYTEDRFDEEMKMTIGVNFSSKRVEVLGKPVTLMLWDLGGQPRFYDVVQNYFRGARLAIAVYDSTRAYTLNVLDGWIQRVKKEIPNCDFLIVGNKADEVEAFKGVSSEDAVAFASKYNAQWMKVSAKTGEGVTAMFEAAAALLMRKYMTV